MSFNLRDALSAIFMKGKYEVGPGYSQFAINQYLAKHKQYIKIVAQLALLKLPDAAHFKYLQKNVSYGWPQKVVEKPEQTSDDKLVEYLIRYYKCSRRDAKDYLLFIDDEEKELLIDYYEGQQHVESITNR